MRFVAQVGPMQMNNQIFHILFFLNSECKSLRNSQRELGRLSQRCESSNGSWGNFRKVAKVSTGAGETFAGSRKSQQELGKLSQCCESSNERWGDFRSVAKAPPCHKKETVRRSFPAGRRPDGPIPFMILFSPEPTGRIRRAYS
jgi:hypothetical protein